MEECEGVKPSAPSNSLDDPKHSKSNCLSDRGREYFISLQLLILHPYRIHCCVRLLMYSSRFVNPSESLSSFLSSASFGFNPFAVSRLSAMPSLSRSAKAGKEFRLGHPPTSSCESGILPVPFLHHLLFADHMRPCS